MDQAKMGLIGLAVMGENLALNIARRGFPLTVFNRTAERTKGFAAGRAAAEKIVPTYSIAEFLGKLERPRRIMLMVKAGEAVDQMIEQLKPGLERGDIIVDGGNSFFRDTARRGQALAAAGIHYFGTGVSGGEEGALKGPCIMPGGPKEAYPALEPVFNAIAAQAEGACCAYIGPGAAGHFVKMVHNGIEYGDMQLIAEAYDLLQNALGLSAPEMSELFARWNEGELGSYLMEITSLVLARTDPETGRPLVDLILDQAGQKGTGKWTSQSALDLGVPTPTIDAAVTGRNLSAYKPERAEAQKKLKGPRSFFKGDREALREAIRQSLYAAKICSYAQGLALMRAASAEFRFGLDYAAIARIWKGGCIIRAKLLEGIKQAFRRDPGLPNLLVDPEFAQTMNRLQKGWREAAGVAVRLGIPAPATIASLAYYDGYRRARLPANLIQAQRDYFGAHTYQRTDKEGTFHTEWQA